METKANYVLIGAFTLLVTLFLLALGPYLDLMAEAIRVNTILPGLFNTPLLQGAPEKVKEALAASVPFPKRLGDPDEYAALAEFMISNGYMNAESVRIDGAIRMAPR